MSKMKGIVVKVLFFSAMLFAMTIVNAVAVDAYWVRARLVDNPSLHQSLNAFYANGSYELFLPHNADASKLTVTVFNDSGTEIKKFSHDFTSQKTTTVSTSIGSFKLTVNVSKLPAIFLEIDESHGTIAQMNSSPDHSQACYGDITVVMPEDMAKVYGCEAVVTSKGNDKKEKTPGTFRLRGRGNTTWKTSTDKQRPYGIKLEKQLNILGMGENKDWALLRFDSPDNVLSNKITYDMAKDFSLAYSPLARMADVYLNDDYIGMYTVTETVEIGSTRVDITDIDELLDDGANANELDLTGGYLLEIDNNPEVLQFSTNSSQITIKAPENLDKSLASGTKYTYIKNHMSDLFDAVYGDGYLSDGRHFSEVLDLQSCAKYFLLQEMTGNYDACRGSTYFYKDADGIDPKIYMGPVWDGDINFRFYPNDWITYHRTISYENIGKYNFLSALCDHKEFTDYLNYYYYDESNPNNVRKICKSYEQNLGNYEIGVSRSAAATARRHSIGQPVYNHYKSYVKNKINFLDKNLKKIINSASKGKNISIKSGDLNAFVRDNKLCYSTNDKSISKSVILGYDDNKKLVYVRKVNARSGVTSYESGKGIKTLKIVGY